MQEGKQKWQKWQKGKMPFCPPFAIIALFASL
jgi:hypothetical protein